MPIQRNRNLAAQFEEARRSGVKPNYYVFQAGTGGSMAEYHRIYGADRALNVSDTTSKNNAEMAANNPSIYAGHDPIGTSASDWAYRFPTSATAVREGQTPLADASPAVQNFFRDPKNAIDVPPQAAPIAGVSPFPTPTPRIITPPPVATPPPAGTLPPVTRPPAQTIAGGATFTQSPTGNTISSGQYGPGGFSTFNMPAADVAPHVAMMDAASSMMDSYPWHDSTNRPEYN